MARKRKRRQQRSEQQASTPAVSPHAGEPLAAADPPLSPAVATSSPRDAHAVATPASSSTSGHAPNASPDDDGVDDELVENLDADLDADDGEESYESLVAAVADIKEEVAAVPADDVGVEEIHDLDDDEAAASVQKLIAQVDREAPPAETRADESDEEVPVIDLDAEIPDASRRGTPAPAPLASPDISRLARAAAAGAVDDSEPRAIPLDLFGDVSTPEARARLLAEALAHAEHKEARYRVPLSDTRRVARWKSAGAALILVLAGVVAVSPPAWVRPEPPAQLSAGMRARGIRLALLLQAQQVEAHRVRTQQLPASLDELPTRLPGVRYARSGRSYQLVAFTPDGSPIVYDAADPSPPFRVLAGALMPMADSP